jgi:hypothetical protein
VVSHRIVRLGLDQIDRVEPLWKEMVAYHREVVEGEWPVRSEADAWARRRREYDGALNDGATKLYERAGFQPYYRLLKAEIAARED